MKKLMIGLVAGVMSVASMVAVAASSVGVVDMQSVFKSAPQVQKINDQLKSQFQNRRAQIVKMGQTLQKDMQNYQKNKSVMKQADATNLNAKIAREENSLRMAQTKFQQDVFAAQNKAMNDFMSKIDGIIAGIAKKKNLDLVIPKNGVLYSTPNMDITNDVVNQLKS